MRRSDFVESNNFKAAVARRRLAEIAKRGITALILLCFILPNASSARASTAPAQGGLAPRFAPTNDSFASPLIVGPLPYESLGNDVSTATNDPLDPAPLCTWPGYQTVWYRYDATEDAILAVDTFGSNYDTILTVWTGSWGSLSSVACNDDASGGLQSKVVFSAVKSEVYYIEVANFFASGASLLSLHAYYGPPSNDSIDTPLVFGALPYTSPAYDITTATTDPLELAPICTEGTFHQSVWYRYDSPEDAIVAVDTFMSDYDTVLAVYAGTPGSLSEVACSDDVSPELRQSRVVFNAWETETYYIQASAYYGGTIGTLRLHAYYGPPPNDNFSAAKVITSLPYHDAFLDTRGATTEEYDPLAPVSCGGPSLRKSVWYSYTAPSDDYLMAYTWGTQYDTVLAVWTGSWGSLNLVLCNDDYSTLQESQVEFYANAGETYYIEVASPSDIGGKLSFQLDPAPSIEGDVGEMGVTLSTWLGTPITLTSDNAHRYYFRSNYGWTGTITPYLSGHSFTPVRRSFYGVTDDLANQDFTIGPLLFSDVPVAGKEWMQPWAEEFYYDGITTGCGVSPLRYCPENNVTRAEMAVFLLRAMHGPGYVPPPVGGPHPFADVPVAGKEWMEPWIVDFYNHAITTGCGTGPLIYCPERAVTRAEMAVFVLRAIHALPYTPPSLTGLFSDVPVTGKEWMEPWVIDFYYHSITTGCGVSPFRYCPENSTTRAEMAVFLGRAFNLMP